MPYAALFPFYANLTGAGRREFGTLTRTSVPPDKVLLRRGEEANGAYLVVQGALRVYYITDEGREATLYHVEPGGTCVLALSSTLSNEPYPAWVQSTQAGATFARIPSGMFHRFLEAQSAFRSFVFGAMAGRIFELMCTLEETATLQVEQRVARYLLRRRAQEGMCEIKVTQARVASDLGTAREVVFRALRSLASRKLIATGRGHIRLLNEQGLSCIEDRRARS